MTREQTRQALDEALADEIKHLFAVMHASIASSREKSGSLERAHFREGMRELLTIYRLAQEVIAEVTK